jgi:hypothetical protein
MRFFAALASLAVVGSAFAGPLVPPAGPIAPTPGPEPRIPVNAANTPGDADSTFRITQPGSYYLTGNFTAAAGRHGIEIAASGITLDLMGFTITGNGGGATIDGIHAESAAPAPFATIQNGVIRAFQGEGIGCAPAGAFIIERIKVENVGGSGIAVKTRSVISNCIVSAAGNFIIGNTCTGNTSNYEIVANNVVGPIIASPLSVAISGSTGGAGTGTTNPWANFSY